MDFPKETRWCKNLPRFFYIHELQKKWNIDIQQICSSDKLEDLVIRSLPTTTFWKFRYNIGIILCQHQGSSQIFCQHPGEPPINNTFTLYYFPSSKFFIPLGFSWQDFNEAVSHAQWLHTEMYYFPCPFVVS